MSLHVDWCCSAAARHACSRWHYSGTVPVSKRASLGVWEGGAYIGAVIFAHGATPTLGRPYGLEQHEACELARVALRAHAAPVSRIVAVAVRLLRHRMPGLRLLVSFADPIEGHHGGIYQAMNWIYTGTTAPAYEWRHDGRRLQRRAFTGHNFGTARKKVPPGAVKVDIPGKHRYLYPLDHAIRATCEALREPYPRQPAEGASYPEATGGADPTLALHFSERDPRQDPSDDPVVPVV